MMWRLVVLVAIAAMSAGGNVVEEILERSKRQEEPMTVEQFNQGWADSQRYGLTYEQYFFYYSGGYAYYDENFYGGYSKGYEYRPPYTYEYDYGYGGGPGNGPSGPYYTWGPQCERKEYRLLSTAERNRLHNALNMAKNTFIGVPPMSQYDIFVAMHSNADAPGAHRGAAFFPWHREFLMRFEQMLRLHEPDLCLPYWDSTIDYVLPQAADSAIWTSGYMGNNFGPVNTGPFAGWEVLSGCEYGGSNKLQRYTGFGGRCFRQADINYLMSKNWYLQIVCQTDCYFENVHGEVHVFVSGQMSMAACAPSDPIFFLHHVFVDCMWEEFRTHSQVTDKELEYPTGGAGSGLNIGGPDHEPFDRMEPWVELYNIHGLSDHYTNYYYRCAPRPHCSNNTCNSPALWCNNGVCTAKIRLGGQCGNYPDEACFQECNQPNRRASCQRGTCTCGYGGYTDYDIKDPEPRHYGEYPTYDTRPQYDEEYLYQFYDSWEEPDLYTLRQDQDRYSYFYSLGQTYVINQAYEYEDQCYSYDIYRDYSRGQYEYGYYQPGGSVPNGSPSNYYTWLPRCQRKEYRQLYNTERNRLHNAMNAMKSSGEWDVMVALHRSGTSPGAHGGAAFLPWHREYLTRLEMALRMHDPEVCLPFWDSTLDSHLPNPEHSAIWTPSYMGNNNGLVTSGAFAGWTTNSGCHYGGLLQLGRSTGPSGRCMYQSDINNVMSKTTFQELVCGIDCSLEGAHGSVHMFVGGQMSNGPCAPSDPIFFMHHAFIDCIWQKFREEQQQSPIETEYPTSTGGSGLNIGGSLHEPYSRMNPWTHLYNIHGLSDHYTNYYYECAPEPRECCSNENCGSDILFCHNGLCKAKVAPNGNCEGLGNDACYCNRRQTARCEKNTCLCTGGYTVYTGPADVVMVDAGEISKQYVEKYPR